MAVKTADAAASLAEPMARAMGFELVDAEFVKENAEWYLRIYIDKRGGILINDCEQLSKALSAALDEEDFITQSYILEVSSPGLDRPLKTDADFIRYLGAELEIKMRKAGSAGGAGVIKGILDKYENSLLYITDAKGKSYTIAREDIKTAKRAIRFK